MATNVDLTTLNGMFKETYASQIENLVPDGVKLLKDIKFEAKEKQPGGSYHQPVTLSHEQGFTLGGSDDDAFNLNAPIASQMKDATVKGHPMVLRSLIGMTSISRAAQGGNKAFMDVTKYTVANMLRSVHKALEIELLYGQMGLGTVASVSSLVITITTAEWAPGIWSGSEGMPIEIRDSAGTTIRGECKVTSVNIAGRTITVDAMPAGVTGTDVIWRKGAYGNEFAGIHKVLSTSGTLFGINNSTYSLFKGNEYAAGSAALSYTKINNAVALPVAKGLDDTTIKAFVNPKAWANMMTDQAALRAYDSSYTSAKATTGGQALEFHSQNGKIEIVPHTMVKEGYAYLLDMSCWSRVGSSDVTFKVPGQGDEFFLHAPNAAGVELRLWADQALFCHKPGYNTFISGIVNS